MDARDAVKLPTRWPEGGSRSRNTPTPRPTHHFEIGSWLRPADYLLFRLPPGWHCEYRRLDDNFGSDHYPLVGTVAQYPPRS